MSWWLESSDGARRRVGAGGLVIGRRPTCALVLADPRASTVQVVLMATEEGVDLRSLGRNPTLVNGRPAARALVGDGDLVEVPGARFTVRRGRSDAPAWVVRHGPTAHGLPSGSLVLGGGVDVDVQLPGLRVPMARLTTVHGSVVVEALAPLALRGEDLDVGDVDELLDGDRLDLGGVVIELAAAGGAAAPTIGGATLPIRASFCFLPSGGRLALAFSDGRQVSLDLPELRARLVALLLQPPGGQGPGDLVPDEVVLPRVWPGQAHRGRLDLNTLVHRTRKELVGAGLNPAPLLVRPRAGHATAFKVARGAVVDVA